MIPPFLVSRDPSNLVIAFVSRLFPYTWARFLRFEVSARKMIWERPDEEGRIGRRPTSVGQLLRKATREIPLADWTVGTGVGLLGPGKQDFEAVQVERNDGRRREPFV
jgi:hypothetical protein